MANRLGNSEKLYFGGLQNHCRRWLQPWNEKTLTPWKKIYDQPRQHIKKQRCFFANKGLSSQSYGFTNSYIWMWELYNKVGWMWRIDVFELWCWRRFLRILCTSRRSNQFILKEISPEHSLKVLMLKLKLQYFGHLMWRTGSFAKTLMLGKIEGGRRRDDRGWDGWMASPTQWTWVWVSSGSWWLTGKPGVMQSMGLQRVGHNWVTELTDWWDAGTAGGRRKRWKVGGTVVKTCVPG